jgi:hypothetical protein
VAITMLLLPCAVAQICGAKKVEAITEVVVAAEAETSINSVPPSTTMPNKCSLAGLQTAIEAGSTTSLRGAPQATTSRTITTKGEAGVVATTETTITSHRLETTRTIDTDWNAASTLQIIN